MKKKNEQTKFLKGTDSKKSVSIPKADRSGPRKINMGRNSNNKSG